jgi:hypothetical protein
VENTRRAITLGLTVAALSMGTLSASIPANASTVPPATGTVTTSGVVEHQAGPKNEGWHYYKSYFWGKDCNKKGNKMVNSGQWKAYRCVGDWRNDYQLWYQK